MHGKHLHYHGWLKSEIVEIYLNLAIRSFALSMGIIFIPIYLIKLGFGLNTVFTYYIMTFVVFGVASLLTARIGKRYGLKHLIMLSIPFYILFFVLLFFLNTVNFGHLAFISVVEGFGSAFYWIPLHSLFAKFSKKKKVSKQAGYIFSLPGMVSVIGPVLGGAIILIFGFKVLLLIISVLLFSSLIPLFCTKDFKPHKGFSFSNILTKQNTRYFGGFYLHGIVSVTCTILWPLFVFFVLKDVFSLGVIGTTVSISVVFFPLLLCRISKRISFASLFKLAGLAAFVVFSFAPFARTGAEVYVASFFIGIILIMVEMPFYTMAVTKAAKKNPLEFMIFRELALSAGRISILLFLLLAGLNFFYGFSVTSVTSLFSLII